MESSLISMESGKADIHFLWNVAGITPSSFTVVYVERSAPLASCTAANTAIRVEKIAVRNEGGMNGSLME
jgi:hypothetical protein